MKGGFNMEDYSPPIVSEMNGDGKGSGIEPLGWIWSTNYVVYVEIGLAAMVGVVVQLLISQIDLTP